MGTKEQLMAVYFGERIHPKERKPGDVVVLTTNPLYMIPVIDGYQIALDGLDEYTLSYNIFAYRRRESVYVESMYSPMVDDGTTAYNNFRPKTKSYRYPLETVVELTHPQAEPKVAWRYIQYEKDKWHFLGKHVHPQLQELTRDDVNRVLERRYIYVPDAPPRVHY